MTERQKYHVLQRHDSFQLRAYEPCVIAQINMRTQYASASSGAFRYLFNYISKGNSTATPISMTAPVIASTVGKLDSTNWDISFVMPSGSSIKDLPLPLDSKVTLHELPEEKCVAMGFRGRATLSLCERKESELRLLAQKENYQLSQEVRISRFDPPFKPGFLNYNEIVIPISVSFDLQDSLI
jgi:SOUL heme-binding protein